MMKLPRVASSTWRIIEVFCDLLTCVRGMLASPQIRRTIVDVLG
jgi:hypothetical protein